MKNIVFLAFDIYNPMSINWIHGFQTLGCKVTVLIANPPLPNEQELKSLGLYDPDFPNIPVFGLWEMIFKKNRETVLKSLRGNSDILFCWEGVGILKHIAKAHSYFPTAKIVFDICTHPNCSNIFAEWRYIWLYRKIENIVSGYVFYSQAQRKLFNRNVPSSIDKPYLVMTEPFLKKAFSSKGIVDSNVPQLKRHSKNPHIIFTGNAKRLWTRSLSHKRKDALGLFLKELSLQGIHIFVHEKADTKGLLNLHVFPTFHNPDLMNSKFSQYISQFDAHLVMYHEFNGTSRRRVASGLATRFSYALTSTCPIAVSSSSKFVKEYSQNAPFYFIFNNIDDLVESLYNQNLLHSLRNNMQKIHKSYAFESRSDSVIQFFAKIL